MENFEDLIKLNIRITSKIYSADDYGVYEVKVLNPVEAFGEDHAKRNGFPSMFSSEIEYITKITGQFDRELFENEEFTAYGEHYEHPKYKDEQYKIQFMKESYDSETQIKNFLKQFANESIVNQIVDKYGVKDVIETILNGEVDTDLIHGMGKHRYESLQDKVRENEYMKDIIMELGHYNLTSNMMKNIIKAFGAKSPQVIKDNPYMLCKVKGIGFKKADQVAKTMGYDLNSPNRIVEAIKYILSENEKSGNVYIKSKKLMSELISLLMIDKSIIVDVVKGGIEDVSKVDSRFCLTKTLNSEKLIAERLMELLHNKRELGFEVDKFVEFLQEEKGIKLTDEQKSLFYNFNKNRVMMLIGNAGCVDADTEFFNGYEWKKISEYEYGDKVLQFDEDRNVKLISPLKYHKYPANELNRIKNMSGSVDQMISDDHTVVYETSKGKIAKKQAKDIIKNHNDNDRGFYGRFLTTFNHNGLGIDLTDDEIRVMVMVIADGHFPSMSHNRCIIRVKKEEKKRRVKYLLDKCKINWKLRDEHSTGYYIFTFPSPRIEKHFTSDWYNCTDAQMKIICDEVLRWDGTESRGRSRFSTMVKESADFVQYAFSSQGRRSVVSVNDRVGQRYKDSKYIRKSIEYYVSISKSSKCGIKSRLPEQKQSIDKVKTKDGFMYCFTTDSGMWVMRRNGRICITGNSGKSFTLSLLLDMIKEMNLSFKLLAPTGKASKVLRNYTGEEAFTIHRALKIGQNPDENEEMQGYLSEDVIIIDETSMMDIKIASTLLSRLDNDNVRIIFIGDDFQIPSVGVGRLLYDLIESEKVPFTKLNKVFRQSDGGTLDIATKVRKKTGFIEDDQSGKVEYGKDAIVHIAPQKQMEKGYKFYYKKAMEKYNAEDIIVLTPTKKGSLGTEAINHSIQEIANPPSARKVEHKFFKTIFREGDQVINIKNNYSALNFMNEEVTIYNGDSGFIKSINLNEKYMLIDYGEEIVKTNFKNLNTIIHSYALTVHKCQGSGYEHVIVMTDKAHTWQMNANLLYTAITRTKDTMVMLCQPSVVKSTIKKNANLQRNTFLKEFLEKEEIIEE